MNDEIKPRYIPADSGNTLPDLGKHGTFNETPVPLHRTRTEPSRAMSDEPMKHLLPGGDELRDIIRKRIASKPQSPMALWEALSHAYQVQPRRQDSVLQAIAAMINAGELVTRDGMIHVADKPAVDEPPEDAVEIPDAMWTMTQTERLLSVLTDEPRTRAWLAERTGLKPKQVSKAMGHLIGQGRAEVVGDVPRTWRRIEDTEPETAVLTEDQTRDVLLERVSSACGEDIVIRDVTRLSGWKRDTVAALIESLLREGALTRLDDERISRPLVRSDDPPEYVVPEYVVGDEDDGEIPEPGVARPVTVYRPVCVSVDFERSDAGGTINGEYSITLDADGLRFDDKKALSFKAINALMPTLKRLHEVLWPCD